MVHDPPSEDASPFGEVIHSYPDQAAVDDGILIPFLARDRDTLHRITATAFAELREYHAGRRSSDYDSAQYLRLFFAELLPLVPTAFRRYADGGILRSDYDFRVRESPGDQCLWYLPNEIGGVTMMLPSDY